MLKTTVANAARIKAATVDLTLATSDGHARVQGPVVAPAKTGDLPKFALTATSGAKTAGVTWTGSRGFVIEAGKAYEVPSALVQMLTASAQQSLGQGPLLGLDVSSWISDPQNQGATTVDGVQVIKIAGKADMAKIEADLGKVTAGMPGVGSLNGASSDVKNATVTVYTGSADQLLRRIVVNADVKGQPAVFDLTLTKVGQPQPIEAPKDVRPLSELMKSGDLSALGLK